MARWLIALIGVAATLAGSAAIAGQVLSGAQPWGPTLTDNMVFAKSLPFTTGLGVLIGALVAPSRSDGSLEQRSSDGALRRFSPGTVALHWIGSVGFILALVTGAWQYLKGVLDVESPVFMPYVYRVHYIGATLLLFSVTAAVVSWWVGGAGLPLPPAGQRIRHLRGLAHELPGPLGGLIAGLLGLDLRRAPPPVERFTYYETTVSFPTWVLLIGLIVITGLLKAMRYVYPIPGEVLWWASALHVAGLVLLAAKLLDHLRYVLAPSRWPLLKSMVTTWLPERYAQRHHPGWYEAIEGSPPAAPSAPSAEAATQPTVVPPS